MDPQLSHHESRLKPGDGLGNPAAEETLTLSGNGANRANSIVVVFLADPTWQMGSYTIFPMFLVAGLSFAT